MKKWIAGLWWIAAYLVLASSATAQLPEKFTNLKILPESIPQRALIDTMRNFARALGVRCEFCHVEKPDGRELDFAKDDKRTKRTARVMFTMVQDLNSKYLTQVVERPTPPVAVRCETCHHGQSRPKALEDVLLEAMTAGGLDSAVQKYRDLRRDYYGSFTYDFREVALNNLGARLTVLRKFDEALGIFRLNQEFFPSSAQVHAQMAETYLARGDSSTGRQEYAKALQMAPDDQRIKRRVSEIDPVPAQHGGSSRPGGR
jgi:tetratricopeptide (TPR) repeat protein